MYSHKPDISVIIPALNEEDYIGWTLKSLRRQTFKNFEIIVSDYKSTDRTVKIAKSLGARVVEADKRGIGAGKNFGAKFARGNILVFCDADATQHKDLLAQIKKLLDRKPDVVGGTNALDTRYEGTGRDRAMFRAVNLLVRLLMRVRFPHDAGTLTFFRKSVFEKLGGFDESLRLAEAHDLALRSRKYGKYGYVKAPIYASLRRYKKTGYWQTYKTYVMATIWFWTTGKVPMEKIQHRVVR
jgi:glycosyltransferase involved in cell wall biosynthesis